MVEDLVWVRTVSVSGGARAIRERAGLSLSELAKEADVSVSCLSRWERGLRRPSGERARRYAAVLSALVGGVKAS